MVALRRNSGSLINDRLHLTKTIECGLNQDYTNTALENGRSWVWVYHNIPDELESNELPQNVALSTCLMFVP